MGNGRLPCRAPILMSLTRDPPGGSKGSGDTTVYQHRGNARPWSLDAVGRALQKGARLPSAWVGLNPNCSQVSEVNLLEGLQNGAFWSGGDGGGLSMVYDSVSS